MAEPETYTTETETEATDTDTTEAETETETESHATATDTDSSEAGTASDTTDTDSSVPELTREEMLRLLEPDPELTDEEKALRALHIVCCRELTEYDPKSNADVCTRFSSFNIALFDLDQESEAIHGPRLQELTSSQQSSAVQSSVNVISLKVVNSDVGYPISVFGTVLARDDADYRCVYLFRRDRDDPQFIESPDDMLTLTGPNRGLVVPDTIFFEFNLRIKGDGTTGDRDFSKGVIEHYPVPFEKGPKAELLSSWLSTVELVLAPVPFAVAATVKIKILNGPCDAPFSGKITAWTAGDAENHIILYEHENRARLIGDGGSIALSRDLVAVHVPNSLYDEYEEIALGVCFASGYGDGECSCVTLQYPQEEKVCIHGAYELQVEVTWTAILEGPFGTDVDKRWSSVPLKPLIF